MKKAIVFLVALILLSFLTNACIGDFQVNKIKNPPPAYSIYYLKNPIVQLEFFTATPCSNKVGLSIITPTILNVGLVANTDQSYMCTELIKLTPSIKYTGSLVLKSKNRITCGRNLTLCKKTACYNYLPEMIIKRTKI